MDHYADWLSHGVLVAVLTFFLRRLVQSFDAFKVEVRAELKRHGEALAAVDERHELEDRRGLRSSPAL